MDSCGVARSVLFGMPMVKMWDASAPQNLPTTCPMNFEFLSLNCLSIEIKEPSITGGHSMNNTQVDPDIKGFHCRLFNFENNSKRDEPLTHFFTDCSLLYTTLNPRTITALKTHVSAFRYRTHPNFGNLTLALPSSICSGLIWGNRKPSPISLLLK